MVACVPTVSATLDFLIDLSVLPNKLLSGVIDLQLSCSQLLHPYVGWSRRLPYGPGVRVGCRGGLPLEDAFDVPLGGFRHEAFLGRVMAPPVGVRAGG